MKLFKQKLFVLLILLTGAFISKADAFYIANHSTFSNSGKPNKDSVIKILAIGNSFSDDAIEHYLYGLAKAGGYKVIIGNLYIGGAPLDLHLKNAQGNLDAYEYRKTDLDGKKERFTKTSLAKALADENWNFISFQQASPKSGLFETYVEPLPLLFNYVKEKATNPKVKYVWHQTWAYAQNSTHNGFASYNKDQMRMYEAIADASKKVKSLVPIDIVVPAGTAIQNARTKLGDVLCRDGYHLDVNVGRYTASCTWYETIFKKNVIGNTYKPDKVNGADALTAQQAAHKAVKKPFKVSKIK
ncbi:hypothetical protein D3C87_377910 [compost metagenome]